jgi:hypothetical protein
MTPEVPFRSECVAEDLEEDLDDAASSDGLSPRWQRALNLLPVVVAVAGAAAAVLPPLG